MKSRIRLSTWLREVTEGYGIGYGRLLEITRDSTSFGRFTLDSRDSLAWLREVTGGCGRFGEVTGGYGILRF